MFIRLPRWSILILLVCACLAVVGGESQARPQQDLTVIDSYWHHEYDWDSSYCYSYVRVAGEIENASGQYLNNIAVRSHLKWSGGTIDSETTVPLKHALAPGETTFFVDYICDDSAALTDWVTFDAFGEQSSAGEHPYLPDPQPAYVHRHVSGSRVYYFGEIPNTTEETWYAPSRYSPGADLLGVYYENGQITDWRSFRDEPDGHLPPGDKIVFYRYFERVPNDSFRLFSAAVPMPPGEYPTTWAVEDLQWQLVEDPVFDDTKISITAGVRNTSDVPARPNIQFVAYDASGQWVGWESCSSYDVIEPGSYVQCDETMRDYDLHVGEPEDVVSVEALVASANTTDPPPPLSLSITKEGQGLITSTPSGLDCGSDCTAEFSPGTSVTLTATADPGWSFQDWSGDVESTDNPLELTIEEDTDLTATFIQDEYTLDVTVVGEGDVDVDPDQETYVYGKAVTLAAIADPGWSFAGWSGDVGSTENPLELTIEGNTNVTATFTQDEYTLDVTIVGEGDVDIKPDQDTYLYSDVVTLTATAHTGRTFAGWGGDVDSTENPLSLAIQDDMDITATFTQNDYTLDVTTVGQGEVTKEPEQDVYHYGDVVTLTATADPGWSFQDWSGDVESTDNPLELAVEGDTVLMATFTQDGYTLDVSIVGQGTVAKEPEQDVYHYGDVVTLTATADPDWTFIGWSGDVDSTDNPLELMLEDDTVIVASFNKKVYLPLVLKNW